MILIKKRIEAWNTENFETLPIYDLSLAEIVKRYRGKNLHFSNLLKENIRSADMIFISVNSLCKTKGIGA